MMIALLILATLAVVAVVATTACCWVFTIESWEPEEL